MVEMWFQHRGNSNIGSGYWEGTSSDGKQESQSHKEIENTWQNQRSGKLLRICELLSKVHSELQLYDKTIEWPKRKKKWKWKEEHQQAFDKLKDEITN